MQHVNTIAGTRPHLLEIHWQCHCQLLALRILAHQHELASSAHWAELMNLTECSGKAVHLSPTDTTLCQKPTVLTNLRLGKGQAGPWLPPPQ